MPVPNYFETKTCRRCEGTAIFFSELGKVLCLKCDELDGLLESENKEQLLPAHIKESLERMYGPESKVTGLTAPDSSGFIGIQPDQPRNEVCNCGSNKKYKKCCLHKVAENRIKVVRERHAAAKKQFIDNHVDTYVKIRQVFKHQEANKWVSLKESEMAK